MTNLLYKFAIAAGACITLIYLFSIKFFPTGMTPGEVVFFGFVALTFGILYCLLLFYGALSSIWFIKVLSWIAHFIRWLRPGYSVVPYTLPALINGIEYLVVSVFICFFAIYISYIQDDAAVAMLLLTFFTAGFISILLATVGRHVPAAGGASTFPLWRRIIAAATVPLVIVLLIGPTMKMVHMVFEGLGVRNPNVSIEVSETELGEIERIAEVIGRPVLDCRRTPGGRLLVHNADVLWSSIGNVAMVSFSVRATKEPGYFSADPKILREAILRLDATSMRIIKTEPKMDPCFDVSADMLFETGNETLTSVAETSLNSVADAILASGTPGRIIVRGHSDARPLSRSVAGKVVDNQHLSELRAEEVAKVLKPLLKVPSAIIVSEGVGRREPKVKCVEMPGMTQYELERCHAPNRRVEIRVHYVRDTKPQQQVASVGK